ncbi:TrmH family RNA methyltransferase [Microlunatus soli]|uniref:tRNA G18 (Ribose-2'-O)-methylase SpoU n=1 Tax=Microlunatus soli TaxID=630515 RepID=A0A1H1P066_9ACTN|nr:RNA methyltransferase [Microlunatus soli]SDS04602.1 tRNA G18 (ribose-2'-O)-methylase SpoU [Microlunatus soli]
MLIEITDPADPRLDDYIRLRDVNLRKHLESERGLFIAEGEKVIRRAIEAGYPPRSFLLAERWLSSLSDVLADHDQIPVYRVTEELAEQVTGFHVHRGALASLHRQQRHTVDDLLALDRLVVAEDIVDHTNVGAILRSAAGLGWQGALLTQRSADPLYRRSIKVSMGSVFSLPWARLEDWGGAVGMLHEHGFRTVALALANDAVDLDQARRLLQSDQQTKIAILLGTEGAGLSRRWIDQSSLVAKIPMYAGIDSLNVAAATAVACYALGPSGHDRPTSA